MIYAGIDYSMSSPSICVWDSTTELKFKNCLVYNFGNWSRCGYFQGDRGNISILKQPTFSCNEERFSNLANWAKAVMIENSVDKVVIEGYSYGSKGNTFEIGENTALLKNALFNLKIPFAIIDPNTIKKNATGAGNAGKDVMYASFVEQEGICLERQMGYHKLGDSKVDVKLKEKPWELKPVDDCIDSFFVLKSHPDIRNNE
ncbi:MAG: hypothetical protein ACRCTP_04145 [Aeromonas popoffii]|uniref:hypothetical protein n=1 Tax=Aeromonas popoffii TaxID=70856 RepID=UPI003F2C8F1A